MIDYEIKNRLNRYELFKFAYEYLKNDRKEYSEEIYPLIEMFSNSMKIIQNYENDLDHKSNFFELRKELEKKIKDIDNNFIVNTNMNYFYDSFLEFEKKNKTIISKKVFLNKLIDAICNYQNDIVKQMIKKESFIKFITEKREESKNDSQIFLSYAYYDAGLTFALFLYFLKNGAFLYVNWMWEGANSSGRITKATLNKELNNSKQFLFLRTIASELRVRGGNHSIRQWCSWEIGNYYAKNPGSKFLLDFYDFELPYKNDMLDTFKKMLYVFNGEIYGK